MGATPYWVPWMRSGSALCQPDDDDTPVPSYFRASCLSHRGGFQCRSGNPETLLSASGPRGGRECSVTQRSGQSQQASVSSANVAPAGRRIKAMRRDCFVSVVAVTGGVLANDCVFLPFGGWRLADSGWRRPPNCRFAAGGGGDGGTLSGDATRIGLRHGLCCLGVHEHFLVIPLRPSRR